MHRPVVIHNRLEKVPELPLLHPAFTLPATHLFIQSIKKLLACCGTCKRSPFVQSATKTALISKSFRSSVEGNTEAVHQVNDTWRPFGHLLHGRLMLQESHHRTRCRQSASTHCHPCCLVTAFTLLMPPCAQTLCDLFTGTRLTRSTWTPSSAKRIVADRPAKPPPITRTRGCVID